MVKGAKSQWVIDPEVFVRPTYQTEYQVMFHRHSALGATSMYSYGCYVLYCFTEVS
jgi:hypothetical protein